MGRRRQAWDLYPRKYSVRGKKLTVYWYYIWGPDGKRHRLSTGKETKQEAFNEVNRRLAEGTALPAGIFDEAMGPTVAEMGAKIWDWDGDFIQSKLLHGQKITPGYVSESAARFRQYIVPVLGERRIRTVTLAELEAIFRGMTKTLKPKTINHVFTATKQVWDECFRLETIDKNPFHRMKPYAAESAPTEILQLADVLEVLERRWWRDDVTWAINCVGAGTGARVAELCALRIEKVLEDRLRIEATVRAELGVVDGTKTYEKGNRWAAFPEFVAEALKIVIAGRDPKEFVFRAEVGNANQYTKERTYSSAHIGLEVPVKQLAAAIDRVNEHRMVQAASRGEEPVLVPKVSFQAWRHFISSNLSSKVSHDSLELHIGHVIKGTRGEYVQQVEAHIAEMREALRDLYRDKG